MCWFFGNNTFQKGASPSYSSRDPRVKSKLLGSIPLWLGKKCVHYFHSRPVFDQFLRESLAHAQHAPDTEISEILWPQSFHHASDPSFRDVSAAKEVEVGQPGTVSGERFEAGVLYCAAQAETQVGQLCAGGRQADYRWIVHLVTAVKTEMLQLMAIICEAPQPLS